MANFIYDSLNQAFGKDIYTNSINPLQQVNTMDDTTTEPPDSATTQANSKKTYLTGRMIFTLSIGGICGIIVAALLYCDYIFAYQYFFFHPRFLIGFLLPFVILWVSTQSRANDPSLRWVIIGIAFFCLHLNFQGLTDYVCSYNTARYGIINCGTVIGFSMIIPLTISLAIALFSIIGVLFVAMRRFSPNLLDNDDNNIASRPD